MGPLGWGRKEAAFLVRDLPVLGFLSQPVSILGGKGQFCRNLLLPCGSQILNSRQELLPLTGPFVLPYLPAPLADEASLSEASGDSLPLPPLPGFPDRLDHSHEDPGFIPAQPG